MDRTAALPVLEVELNPKEQPSPAALTATRQADAMTMIIELASNPAVDVDKLQRLIDMQKDARRDHSIAAFNQDFAAMQAVIPTVIEKGKGDKGMSYARLEDIVETVRPVLQRHGFSLSHQTEWPDKTTIKVIGILTHREGHERRSEFLASADQTGSKNAIQALGSSNSYGRRYTTKDLLNIVTKEEDDDGKKAGAPAEPDGKVEWKDAAGKREIGYAEWIDLMDALVLDGATKKQLDEKWYAAPEAFRKHMAAHDRQHIEGWKKKAVK
jgi:hypothetical protein